MKLRQQKAQKQFCRAVVSWLENFAEAFQAYEIRRRVACRNGGDVLRVVRWVIRGWGRSWTTTSPVLGNRKTVELPLITSGVGFARNTALSIVKFGGLLAT